LQPCAEEKSGKEKSNKAETMSNDNHPQQPDREPWHEAKPSGQYRSGADVTGAKSWQCRFAGCTVYGMKSRAEALAKIRELRDEKLRSDFFNLDSL
jgi:hypothetical protein